VKVSQARKYWGFDHLDNTGEVWRYEILWAPANRELSLFYLPPNGQSWEYGHSKFVLPRTDVEVAVAAMRRFVTGSIGIDGYEAVLP
jgi:hypothetical protein